MAGYLAWDIGVARLVTYDEDGFPGVQLDTYNDGSGSTAPYESHSPHGLFSIPLDPDVDSAGNIDIGCTTFYAMEGGKGHALVMSDPRAVLKLAELKAGETMLYNSYGAFVRLAKDGAASIFTTDDGTMTGRSVYLRVAPDEFRFVAPWGSLVFDASGFHLVHASGARIDLGGIYDVPGVPSELTTYINLQAHTVDIPASVTSHGAGPTQDQLAFAKPIAIIVNLLISAIGKLPAPMDPATLAAIQAALASLPADAVSS